jgi:hypothetical protein
LEPIGAVGGIAEVSSLLDLKEDLVSHKPKEFDDNEIFICDNDLTDQGVMMSEFSTPEMLKYVHRSNETEQRDFNL